MTYQHDRRGYLQNKAIDLSGDPIVSGYVINLIVEGMATNGLERLVMLMERFKVSREYQETLAMVHELAEQMRLEEETDRAESDIDRG